MIAQETLTRVFRSDRGGAVGSFEAQADFDGFGRWLTLSSPVRADSMPFFDEPYIKGVDWWIHHEASESMWVMRGWRLRSVEGEKVLSVDCERLDLSVGARVLPASQFRESLKWEA